MTHEQEVMNLARKLEPDEQLRLYLLYNVFVAAAREVGGIAITGGAQDHLQLLKQRH